MGDFSILAKRIKELRASLNLTQKQFTELVGCTQATLSAYENGAKSPSLEIVKGIAEKCGVSIDWLCGLSDEKNNVAKFETYADILKVFVELSDIEFQLDDISPSNVPLEYLSGITYSGNKDTAAVLATAEYHICKFVREWIEIRNLFRSGTIKEDLYRLWIKDKLNEDYYNSKIEKGLPFLD